MRHVVFLFLLVVSFFANAKTLVVDQKRALKSIQSAIMMAASGDTVQVMPGLYREGNYLIKKSIVFIGVDYPTLDGENKYEIFTVIANDVSIIGFQLVNTGTSNINDISAVNAQEARGLRILNNRFENTFFGIHLGNSTESLIENNVLNSSNRPEHQIGNGIHAWKCDAITIRQNEISGHRDGIYFEFVTHSRVEKNFSHENKRYGLHFMFSHHDDYINNTFHDNGAGVAVMYTQDVKMIGNHFEYNWGSAAYGLLLKDIRDSHIEGNQFSKNTIGIYMEGSSRCSFQKNLFQDNGWAVKIQANCDGNSFEKNSFLSNTFDMATNGSLVLNRVDYNYWDNYQGYDLDKNGIGDVPYRPVNLYSMIVEKMPSSIMLWRSFLVYLLDRTEKVVPSIIPENLKDIHPAMKNYDFNR